MIGDALEIAFGGGSEQPHQQEEGHHRGDEVGVGDLPRPAVGCGPSLADASDDNRLLRVVAHDLCHSLREDSAASAGDREHIRPAITVIPCGS